MWTITAQIHLCSQTANHGCAVRLAFDNPLGALFTTYPVLSVLLKDLEHKIRVRANALLRMLQQRFRTRTCTEDRALYHILVKTFDCQELTRSIRNRRRNIQSENDKSAPKPQALGTRAYEASRMDQANGAPLAQGGGSANTGGHGEEDLSADHQLLCQIGNCLQLDAVSTTA